MFTGGQLDIQFQMAMEFIHLKMDQNLKEILKMDNGMDLVLKLNLMG